MWQRGKRLSWGEAKGVDSGTKGRWLPMIVNKRGVDVCWLVPASPAISFSLLLPHRASFRHVLPRPHINTQVPRSTPLWSIKPQEAVCQVSEIRVCPPAGDSSSVKEQWESSRESGEAGVDWRQRQKEKGTCAPQGISQGVHSLGEIIDACSGWSMCIFSYIGQRDTDKDMSRRLTT